MSEVIHADLQGGVTDFRLCGKNTPNFQLASISAATGHFQPR
ncbi:MAG: hypothetical protein VYC16_02275 [Pseudomonadota bacterium]|nr:hypothetical protein [Pseudomonadota bacterium]